MEIRMPISFFGSYEVVVRSGASETREKVQKLAVSELPSREGSESAAGDDPTHLIVFFSFGCRRVVQGKLTVNEEDKVVFRAEDREYEFMPLRPAG